MQLLPTNAPSDGPPTISPNATLILPAISIGNVGQLAMDLLIESCRPIRNGRLKSPSLLPFFGRDAYSHISGPVYAVELYHIPSTNIYLIQQRSPAAPGLQQQYAEDLAAWAKNAGFKTVWIVGSLDGRFRRDDQIRSGTQLRWTRGVQGDSSGEQRRVSEESVLPLEQEYFDSQREEEKLMPPWTLLRAFEKENITDCIAILAFVLEGDNRKEAMQAARAVNRCVDEGKLLVQEEQWKEPPSWKGIED